MGFRVLGRGLALGAASGQWQVTFGMAREMNVSCMSEVASESGARHLPGIPDSPDQTWKYGARKHRVEI